MVALGLRIRHHLIADGRASLLFASRRLFPSRLLFTTHGVAGHSRFGRLGIFVRPLHHLSTPPDSLNPQRAGAARGAVSFDQRERRGVAETGIGKTLQYRLQHKNGNWLVLESTSSVIRNAQGEPEKLVIVNRDPTERKRAEEALQRSEADFRSLVEDAPYGICRASVTG